MSAGKSEALSLIKQALAVWQVDPDEDAADELETWEQLLEIGDKLARLTGEPKPGG